MIDTIKPHFSVNATSDNEADVSTNYNLFNEVRSSDESVTVSGGSSPIEISVSVEVSSELSGVFEIAVNPDARPPSEDDPGFVQTGVHRIRMKDSVSGIFFVSGGNLSVMELPEDGRARMLIGTSGGISWSAPAPESGDCVFGRKGNTWGWWEIGDCESPCDE